MIWDKNLFSFYFLYSLWGSPMKKRDYTFENSDNGLFDDSGSLRSKWINLA
jgi:hypothetical protein